MADAVRTYSLLLSSPVGSTGTGLDQLIAWDARDGGLAGANEAAAIAAGITAADGLNRLVIEGLQALNLLNKEVLSSADIVALNGWVRGDSERLARFIALHGDDEGGAATGFHQIQGNGGNRRFQGNALIDTIQDGIYHFGFPLSADGTRFTNEDGADNALLTDVARWLTALKTDLTSTNTGLDRIVETIVGDPGLGASIPWPQIKGGATAADGLNSLIVSGIAALNQAGASDADNTRLSSAEVLWINDWIRKDTSRYASFVALHGDDENGVETGYHLVQNDGGNTTLFGRNAINTIFDGIYHIGFGLTVDGRFVNEDGNANAKVSDVADWISYYYGDPSTTGTSFDRLTDWMRLDPGLAKWTSASDINDGLAAADGILHLYVDAIAATGVNGDGWISKSDLRLINSWIVANRHDQFVALHGDDEDDGSETGFHKIQNDGGSTQFFGRNLINTVADGMFHIGFRIEGENFLNEDGDTNQSLSDVSSWVNAFLNNSRLTVGTSSADGLVGNDERDQLLGNGDDDLLQGHGDDDLLDGGWGDDTLQGGSGADLLDGGFDDDWLDGGDDGDTVLVSGANPEWVDGVPYSFQGFDTYGDSGSSGTDSILAQGDGPVDIGFRNFGPASGIEQIVNATDDGNGGNALVRLLGDWHHNLLDFSSVSLVGSPFLIEGGWGRDTIRGSHLADSIKGGFEDDTLDGGQEGDTYLISGAGPEWIDGIPYTFEGFDSYADSGSFGTDSILAQGDGPVDIGFRNFSPADGIEQIVNASDDGNGGSALVQLLGDWHDNQLDFSSVSLIGGPFLIDGGEGDDSIQGSGLADSLRGGREDDTLDGGQGGDTYLVSGCDPNNSDWATYDFEGYDSYADSGSIGVDQIVAVGQGPVDLGLRNFGPSNGIEQIINGTSVVDALGASSPALVRLLGNWQANRLDFSTISLIGGSVLIDGEGGKDSLTGSSQADRLHGGLDDDRLDGGAGDDLYEVRGNNPANTDWATYSFEGYDTIVDSGGGFDQIVAMAADGSSAVDIGLSNFGPASGIERIDARGTTGLVRLLGDWQANSFDFSATELRGSNLRIELGDGNDNLVASGAGDQVWGGYGNDQLRGGSGQDSLNGGGGDDTLDGGSGSDTYLVSGVVAGGWQSFGGNDLYSDSGSGGLDRIVAIGEGDGDIGLAGGNFLSGNGIEQLVNATTRSGGGTGTLRLLGNWDNNLLDLRNVSVLGSSLRIEAGDGNDSIEGSSSDDVLQGGKGDDVLNGRGGSDTYEVSGNIASDFCGYDTYSDSGSGVGEIDRLLVVSANGSEAVDIGLRSFGPGNGIERIDASATSGRVRLLGDSAANSLNFSGVSYVGANLVIDTGGGNDSVVGSAGADRILAGTGIDNLNGAGGSDTYEVSGTSANGFGRYDNYADNGSGVGESDRIVAAAGSAAVDIGLTSFSAANGIEVIDATATTGTVRLLGDGSANSFNFSGISLLGSNLAIDLGAGNDTCTGSAAADRILAGTGNDSLNGAGGSDTYEVIGTSASGFGGYDSYADSGSGLGESDRIVAAAGSAAVDIGLVSFSAANGIEVIDATATSGAVRLLGDGNANSFNFSGISLLGSNLAIDLGAGNDSVVGSAGADRILAGTGGDRLNGGEGNDTLSGGGGLDTLTGGGGSDCFNVTTLSDGLIGGTSSVPLFERITDFVIGQDSIDVTTAPPANGFRTLGNLSSLTTSSIGTLLNSTNFVANGAATFTYGGRTFVALNNGTAGYGSTSDAVLEISGYSYASGVNSLSQISIV